jgi:hypothetical protein
MRADFESRQGRLYSGMQMDEQVEHSISVTLSLTPRRVAVTSEGFEPKTVSTVFLPTQMFVSMTPARLTIRQGIEARQRETVKTVDGF